MIFFKKIHFFFTFLLFFYNNNVINAFNITAIFTKYPDYTTFNSYLTQTQVAGGIMNRQPITVLAVSNVNVGPLSGKSTDDQMAIMSVHVILDYYDMKKLQSMAKNSTSSLTTFYQSSGKAKGKQGFVNVTISINGDISFGSAVPGSSPVAKLVDSVYSQPYNLSILQVSSVIIPSAIDNSATNSSTNSSTTPPSSSPTTSPVPASSPGKNPIPIPTPRKSPSPSNSPPSPPAPTPVTPSSNAPAPAEAPSNASALSPTPSLTPTIAPTPDAADEKTPSLATTHLGHGLSAMLAIILSTSCFLIMF